MLPPLARVGKAMRSRRFTKKGEPSRSYNGSAWSIARLAAYCRSSRTRSAILNTAELFGCTSASSAAHESGMTDRACV